LLVAAELKNWIDKENECPSLSYVLDLTVEELVVKILLLSHPLLIVVDRHDRCFCGSTGSRRR
jgi:hypothetical protein